MRLRPEALLSPCPSGAVRAPCCWNLNLSWAHKHSLSQSPWVAPGPRCFSELVAPGKAPAAAGGSQAEGGSFRKLSQNGFLFSADPRRKRSITYNSRTKWYLQEKQWHTDTENTKPAVLAGDRRVKGDFGAWERADC